MQHGGFGGGSMNGGVMKCVVMRDFDGDPNLNQLRFQFNDSVEMYFGRPPPNDRDSDDCMKTRSKDGVQPIPDNVPPPPSSMERMIHQNGHAVTQNYSPNP